MTTKELNRRELIGMGVAGIGAAVLSKEVMADQQEAMPTVKEISAVGWTKTGEIHFGKADGLSWTNGRLAIGKLTREWSIEFGRVEVTSERDVNKRFIQTGHWTASIKSLMEPSVTQTALYAALGTSGTLMFKDKTGRLESKHDGVMLTGFSAENCWGDDATCTFHFAGTI